MTIKDALYRELKYGLAGTGGGLENLIDQDHIKMDMRNTPSSLKSESDYPWLIFRRVKHAENKVRYARPVVEITIIGLRSSATKGDDLLEEMREAIIDHFSGKHETWGKFEEDGTPDPNGGLRALCKYVDTVEDMSGDLDEKAHTLVFGFAYVRE